MQRWIARFLVFVTVVPAFGPLALASAAPRIGPHCQRQAVKPKAECHRRMAMAPEEPSSGASFKASDSCCPNHDCCRGVATPRWAQLIVKNHSQHSVPAADAPQVPAVLLASNNLADDHSARAPPRS